MNQRTSLTVGLVMAILGTAVLGIDRSTASADTTSFLGQTTSMYTWIGVGLLAIAAIWIFLVKPKQEQPKNNQTEAK